MVNPKVTNIAVPALNGGFLPILLTLTATARAEVQEDPSVNAGVPQGLVGYYVDAAIATPAVMQSLAGQPGAVVLLALQKLGALKPAVQQSWLATAGGVGTAYQPIELGDWLRIHAGNGEYIGVGGECILLLTSATATATQVLLTEWK